MMRNTQSNRKRVLFFLLKHNSILLCTRSQHRVVYVCQKRFHTYVYLYNVNSQHARSYARIYIHACAFIHTYIHACMCRQSRGRCMYMYVCCYVRALAVLPNPLASPTNQVRVLAPEEGLLRSFLAPCQHHDARLN